jgi:hypothetical protein
MTARRKSALRAGSQTERDRDGAAEAEAEMTLHQFLDYLASYPHSRQLGVALAEVFDGRRLQRTA